MQNVAKRFRVKLNIPVIEIEKYYRGLAVTVQARAETGESIAFPAISLRPFVKADGVHGRFELITDSNHKLLQIRCLNSN